MMAAMRYRPDEASQPNEWNEGDVIFIDRVLDAWAIDAHEGAAKLGYPEAGNIWGIISPVENRKILNLDGEQLMRVDGVIAPLPWRAADFKCRKLIFVEYFSRDPQGVKADRFGVSVRGYFRRLKELQQLVYDRLQPEIETWRARCREL